MIGSKVGQYRVVAQLGRGSAGTVYRAVDETLDREVAIKVLNPDLADPEILRRFRTEATTLARLNHPAIAIIYELFRSGSDLLMVMEFVRGETLEVVASRLGPLPPDQAAYLVDRLLWGLEHAHRAGVVHRDVKPANVMITANAGLKITDFGIARVRGAEHVTAEGCMLGTPAYMAPEQVFGTGVDARADLYSAGVILYRLLSGTLPFTAQTPVEMLQKQVAEPATPLHERRPDLPAWCGTVVERALAKRPEDRFQSAEEFRQALAEGAPVFRPLAADVVQVSQHILAGLTPRPVGPRGWWPQRGDTVIVVPTGNGARAGTVLAAVAASVMVAAYLAAPRRTPDQRPAQTPVVASAERPRTAPAGDDSSGVNPTKAAAASGPDKPASNKPLPKESAPRESAPRRPTPENAEKKASPPAREVPKVTAAASEATAALPPSAAPEKKPPPSLAFDTTTLVGSGDKYKERHSRLMLAQQTIRVAVEDDGKRRLVHSVPYEDVLAISYSRGKDPLWMSPDGPAAVTRGGGGMFGVFRRGRHWIALRTNTSERFVILRADEETAGKLIGALEERTGRKVQILTERKSNKKG